MLYFLIKKLPYRIKKLFPSFYGKMYLNNEIFPLNKKYAIEDNKSKNIQNILHINAITGKGGASKVAYDLLSKNLTNYDYKILTSKSYVNDDNIIEFINHSTKERKLFGKIEQKTNLLDFYQFESLNITKLQEFKNADILHLHNLHGDFINPFILPEITSFKPTIWTLHDFGAFTGYCTVEYSCNNYKSGCMCCPYLKEQGLKDTANYIWNRKKEIYQNSYLTITVPSLWLKDKVEKSILNHFQVHVIPHGINTDIFKPEKNAREKLNLPTNKKILLFSSDFGEENPNKGGKYLKQVFEHFKNREDILFVILGGEEEKKEENIIFKPYVYDENELANYYSAADLFIYPSLADSFGLVVAEAMACGLPVVTFKTGGIPEILEHNTHGYIAEQHDIDDFINGIENFIQIDNPNIQENCRNHIQNNFNINIMIDKYIRLYKQVVEKDFNENTIR